MKIELENINSELPYIDLFIGAISFENRCFKFIESVDPEKIGEKWFAYNENEKGFYKDHLVMAENYPLSKTIAFSSDDPLITAKTLLTHFQEAKKVSTLFVDTSTFTHEGLLILFKFIYLFRGKFERIFFVYVSAKSYSTNENDEDKWLSKGTKTIRSVLGYPGVLNPSQKNHLIILFGFEIERTTKLIEQFEFDKVSIGVGPVNASISENHYSINRKRHIDLLAIYNTAETFEFSLTDPLVAYEQVKAQIAKYANYNVVICPQNNKISTIGAGLIGLGDLKVQICYVRPHEYNYKGYSEPADECYIYEVPFS